MVMILDPKQLLEECLNSENEKLRGIAALNFALSLEQQHQILNTEKDSEILQCLAVNPVISFNIQEKLYAMNNEDVNEGLANNVNLDISLQNKLAKYGSDWVRLVLAELPTLHLDLWETLRNDPDKSVRRVINERIDQEKDKIKAEFKEKINK